jgi:hypothetical protein
MSETQRRLVWTTEKVKEAEKKLDDGYILKGYEIPFFEKKPGLRKAGISFSFSDFELEEYLKCKLDITYFIENYCFVKSEDGLYHKMSLRDYQYDIVDLFKNNKMNILMASRQVGKTIVSSIFILHFMLFNNSKNVLLAANILDTSQEVLDKMKTIYSYLPFFLQQGIEVWNVNQIKFENMCRAKAFAMTKNASIGNTGDLVYIDEFAHIQNNIANKFYKSIFPTLTSIENSKMIITSTPNGYNLFYKLLTDSEREKNDPLKKNFGTLRVYWYQVPGRNVTYIKLNSYYLQHFNLTKEMVFNQTKKKYNPNDLKDNNKIPIVEMKKDPNSGEDWIHIQNSEELTFEKIQKTEFINKDDEVVHSSKVATLSTWKQDTTNDIGGEDNFNQEYDLRFTAGSRSVINEESIKRLTEGKVKYKSFSYLDNFDKIKWSWEESLQFREDWEESRRKNMYGLISIDVSEGLGQDYSVINMFELKYKDFELIEKQKDKYSSIQDFFTTEQFGVFRSNIVSVEQLSEMVYILIYEFFDPDKFKAIIEYNNDGKSLLVSLKNVFDGENNYSGFPIMKFKHRVDAQEKTKGLKVGNFKNKYVRDYQERIEFQDIVANEDNTIKEIGTFIAHTTNAGNVIYKGDGSNDDLVMTLVNMSQAWHNTSFRELIEEYHQANKTPKIDKLINDILYSEKTTGTDYNSFFDAKSKTIRNNKPPGSIVAKDII